MLERRAQGPQATGLVLAAYDQVEAVLREGLREHQDIKTRVSERSQRPRHHRQRPGVIRAAKGDAAQPLRACDLHQPDADLTKRLCAQAIQRGLVLLSCGTYSNVIRILVPLTASDALVDEGLAIIEASLAAAQAA